MLHLKAEFRTKQTHDGTLMHVKRDSFQCLATVGPGQKQQGRAGITKIWWRWWSERSQKKNALTWGQRDKGRERQLVWQGGSITFGSWIPADPWVRRGIKIKMESWAQEKHVWYIWNSSCYIYILFPRSFWCFWICMQRQYFLHQAKYIYYGLDLFSDSAH